MASLAQPEMDLGWWLYFDRQFSEGLGVPRPAGFGSHEDTIARYSELMGRPMRDIFYYEIFSGFRFAVVMYRLSDLVFDREDMEGDADMATDNIATQLLAKMLEPGAADLPAVRNGVAGRAHGDAGRHEALAQPVRALVALFAHGLLPARRGSCAGRRPWGSWR